MAAASAEHAFVKRDQSDAGMSVILYYGHITRYNKKGKALKRMLIITRTHVIVAYEGGTFAWIGKPEGRVSRVIRIAHIKEVLRIQDRVGLRVRATGDGMEFDLLFSLQRARDVERVVQILSKCYSQGVPHASPLRVTASTATWKLQDPPLRLAKPKNWKVEIPEDLMVLPWSTVAAGQRAQVGPLRASAPRAIVSPLRERTPPQSPVRAGLELPPIATPPREDEEAAARARAQLLSEKLKTDPGVLREELADLKQQAAAMTRQQKLHMATLDASQRIVSLLVNESCGGFSGFRGKPPIASIREPPAGASPLRGPPPHYASDTGNGNGSSPARTEALDASGMTLIPPPPRGPPPPLPPPAGPGYPFRGGGGEDDDVDGAPLPPPPPAPPALAVSPELLQSPSPERRRAVEYLEEELNAMRDEMHHELTDKDRQIDTLRAALQSVLDENDELRQGEEEEEEEDDDDDDMDWGSEDDEEEAYSDEESAESPFDVIARGGGGGARTPQHRGRSRSKSAPRGGARRGRSRPHASHIDPNDIDAAADLADTHARSLQTRRREVEELTRQLDLLEKDRARSDPAAIKDLRRQLKAVLADLELEALSYHDAFATGLPPTQVFNPPAPAASPRRSRGPQGQVPSAHLAGLPPPEAPRAPPPQDPGVGGAAGYPPEYYEQWAQYCNYLATYYPSAYAAYYAQSQQAQQQSLPYSPTKEVKMNYGSTASHYASSQGGTPLHSNAHWQKWSDWQRQR